MRAEETKVSRRRDSPSPTSDGRKMPRDGKTAAAGSEFTRPSGKREILGRRGNY